MQFYAPGSRKGNRTFVVRGPSNGRQVEKVLAATKLADAKKEAEQFFAAIKGREPGAVVSFREAAHAFLQGKRLGKQDLAYIDRLVRFFGDKLVGDMIGSDLTTAAHALCPRTSDSNKNRAVIGPASSILHFAAEQGWCADRRHRRLKVSRRSPRRPVAADTMRLLLANTTGHKHLFLVWLYETGQRITDSLRLRREDFDLPAATARVGSTKTDDIGEIGLSPELVAMLASAPHLPSGRVFPWGDRHNVYRWLKPLCARLKVTYTPHQSRHAMATDLRALGYDMRAIAERGLWRDERSAGRYVHHRSPVTPDRGVVILMGEKRGRKRIV